MIAIVLWASPAHAQSAEADAPPVTIRESASRLHVLPEEAAPASTLRESSSRFSILIGAEVILHSVDMFTTVHNLQYNGGRSAREANPLLAPFSQSPVALVAVSGAVNVLQVFTIAKLRPRHPKLAAAWVLILIGTEAYAVSNNIRVANQIRRAGQ